MASKSNPQLPNIKEKLLELIAIMHSGSSSILIGFAAVTNKGTSISHFITALLVVGLLSFFATFLVLFFSYKRDNDDIDYNWLVAALCLSLLTQICFIVLIIISIYSNPN